MKGVLGPRDDRLGTSGPLVERLQHSQLCLNDELSVIGGLIVGLHLVTLLLLDADIVLLFDLVIQHSVDDDVPVEPVVQDILGFLGHLADDQVVLDVRDVVVATDE